MAHMPQSNDRQTNVPLDISKQPDLLAVSRSGQDASTLEVSFCGGTLPDTPVGNQDWVPRVRLEIDDTSIHADSAQRLALDSPCWQANFLLPATVTTHKARFTIDRWVWSDENVASERLSALDGSVQSRLHLCEAAREVFRKNGLAFTCGIRYNEADGAPRLNVTVQKAPGGISAEDINQMVIEEALGHIFFSNWSIPISIPEKQP
jgi:hypothetical protein